MADDAQLLRQYAETKSEAAFAALVQRHLGLVYHAAVRQLGSDRHLAEDVAQAVFILLAEKSPTLLAHTSLAGWLHSATHFKVGHALRAERRRRIRDEAALAMSDLVQTSSPEEWERIRPVLDHVLQELNPSDREAVLLRFFENHPFAEIAARLAVSESAAHKRVERALEKLRERLARRGVQSTAAALGLLLGAQAAGATPTGLATTVTAGVVASGLPVATALGGITFMSTKTTAVAAGVAIALLSGVATFQVNAQRDTKAALLALDRDNTALQARLRSAENSLAEAGSASAAPAPAAASPSTQAPSAVPGAQRSFPTTEENRAFLEANPEVREALVTYFRHSLRSQYADIIADLKLTEEEAERFVAIRALGRGRVVGNRLLFPSEESDSVTGGELARQTRELLGPDRYTQFEEYERAGAERGLSNALVEVLYTTSDALAPAQVQGFKQLVAAALADPAAGARTDNGWAYLSMAAWDQILARAEKVLSTEQVVALRDLREQSRFQHAQAAAATKSRESRQK